MFVECPATISLAADKRLHRRDDADDEGGDDDYRPHI